MTKATRKELTELAPVEFQRRARGNLAKNFHVGALDADGKERERASLFSLFDELSGTLRLWKPLFSPSDDFNINAVGYPDR
jgi:hypothetical protein